MPSSHTATRENLRGVGFGFGAYFIWGLFPLYWKPLFAVSPLEILCHRVLWSALLLVGLVSYLGQGHAVRQALRQPRVLGLFAASALCLSLNWLLYIWAVGHGQVLESSLGYFITPLMNVLLGALVLGERLGRLQTAAVALAAAGVAWLTLLVGAFPWVALGLAVSFSLYGLLRKTAALASLEGLTLETLMLCPLALAGLAWFGIRGSSGFISGAPLQQLLLAGSGVVTTIPLLMFAGAARRLKLATIGLIQYISPTLQFMLGLWVFHEPFDSKRLGGFVLIWIALALYSAAGLYQYRRARLAQGSLL
jgi:chloramphenicol-sensitive protein RarD